MGDFRIRKIFLKVCSLIYYRLTKSIFKARLRSRLLVNLLKNGGKQFLLLMTFASDICFSTVFNMWGALISKRNWIAHPMVSDSFRVRPHANCGGHFVGTTFLLETNDYDGRLILYKRYLMNLHIKPYSNFKFS